MEDEGRAASSITAHLDGHLLLVYHFHLLPLTLAIPSPSLNRCQLKSRMLLTPRIRSLTTNFRCAFARQSCLQATLTHDPSGAPPPIPEGGIAVACNSSDKVQLRLGPHQESEERTPCRGRRHFTRYRTPPSVILLHS